MGLRNWITKVLARSSSSDVRELKSIDVPLSVLDYIEKNDLYFMKKIETLYQRPSARPFALGGPPGLRDRPTE
jgi:hypothetical protein